MGIILDACEKTWFMQVGRHWISSDLCSPGRPGREPKCLKEPRHRRFSAVLGSLELLKH